MDATIKEQWIEALLSGRYTQGRAMLRRASNHYCCLGVLCDVINPAAWNNTEGKYFWRYGDTQYVILPNSIMNKANLTHAQHSRLVAMNDIEHKTFAEIAEYIRTL